MAYAINGPIGTNFTTVTAGTTTDGVNALQPLGICVIGSDGATRQYVQASAALALNSWVCITETFQAALMTKALVDAGHAIGVVHDVAFSDNDLGWVVVNGPATAKIAAACAPDVQLYTTATAGLADDTSASQTLIRGAVSTVLGVTASTSAKLCLLTNPSGTATP